MSKAPATSLTPDKAHRRRRRSAAPMGKLAVFGEVVVLMCVVQLESVAAGALQWTAQGLSGNNQSFFGCGLVTSSSSPFSSVDSAEAVAEASGRNMPPSSNGFAKHLAQFEMRIGFIAGPYFLMSAKFLRIRAPIRCRCCFSCSSSVSAHGVISRSSTMILAVPAVV